MREEILVDIISKQIITAETTRILRFTLLALFISIWMRLPRIRRFQIFPPCIFSLTLHRPHP